MAHRRLVRDVIVLERYRVSEHAIEDQSTDQDVLVLLGRADNAIRHGEPHQALAYLLEARGRVRRRQLDAHELAGLAESEPTCPDYEAAPGHGRAA
jgi:hypothetical protein